MNNTSAEQLLESSILNYARALEDTHGLLTGWIVIAEFVDSDGSPHLCAYASPGLPYWRVDGMINAAPDEIAYLAEDEEYG